MEQFCLVIEFLNWLFSDLFMLAAWGLVAAWGVVVTRKSNYPKAILIPLACIPPMIYYLWALTGLWSSHEVATAFNRGADFSSIIIILMFLGDTFYATRPK